MDIIAAGGMTTLLSAHKQQVLDIVLVVLMMIGRGFYLRRKARRLFSDMLMCGLLAWFMKPLFVAMSLDGALSGLGSLVLGYLGSGTVFHYLRQRFDRVHKSSE